MSENQPIITVYSGGIEVQFPDMETVHALCHTGQCDSDVEAYVTAHYGYLTLTLSRDIAASILREYGAWDDLDTADEETLYVRILWLAAGDAVDRDTTIADIGV